MGIFRIRWDTTPIFQYMGKLVLSVVYQAWQRRHHMDFIGVMDVVGEKRPAAGRNDPCGIAIMLACGQSTIEKHSC